MKVRLISFFVVVFAIQTVFAQLTSLGSVNNYNSSKLYFLGNQLYAATSQGLYQRELNGAESEWEKLSFADRKVIDFVVRTDTLIALNDSCLMISTDGGRTSKFISVDAIAPGWKEKPYYNGSTSIGKIQLQGLAVHPHDAKKIYVAYKGLSYTEDGGETWRIVDEGMHIEGIFYNPLDADNLIACAHTTTDLIVLDKYAKVYVSTDAGTNWTLGFYGNYTTTTMKGVAFHPTDASRVLLYGTGIYAMSNDYGQTWQTIKAEPNNPIMDTPLVYLDYLIYDSRNPNVLYGADWEASYETEKKVRILRSTDSGLSWDVFYTIDNSIIVRSMSMNDGVLAIATAQGGIFLLNVEAVESSIVSTKIEPTTSYYDLSGRKVAHPTRGIYIEDGKKVLVNVER